MPQERASLELNDFRQGLLTEASPLNSPANTLEECVNLIINRDGSVQRRLGLDVEDSSGTIFTYTPSSDGELSLFLWEAANGDSDENLIVVHRDDTLYFLDADTTNPSANVLDTLTLSRSITDVSFAKTPKNLLVVSPDFQGVYLISWDAGTTSASSESIYLKIRDLASTDNDFQTDGPKDYASKDSAYCTHYYFMLNAGWRSEDLADYDSYQDTNIGAGNYLPPASGQAWRAKDGSGVFQASEVEKQYFGQAYAPSGKFVVDIWNRGGASGGGGRNPTRQNAIVGLTGASLADEINAVYDSSDGGITAVEFFAGRAWYMFQEDDIELSSYVVDPGMETWVAFSQVGGDKRALQRCYQEADPTAEYIHDIIATDGGVIPIQNMRGPLALVPYKKALLVFAKNGIWQIIGGEQGFSATEYIVDKVSDVGALNKESIIAVDDTVLYWAKSGIYAVQPDRVTGDLQSVNLSLNRIDTFYNDIGLSSKKASKGFYDSYNKQVYWLYNDNITTTEDSWYRNKALVFNIALGAFYTHTFDAAVLSDAISLPEFYISDENEAVKFLVKDGSNATLAEFNNTTWKDFEGFSSETTADADGYFITNHLTADDTQRQKFLPYLTIHSRFTETGFTDTGSGLDPVNPSSVRVQVRWDFSDSSNGKFTDEFEAYRLLRNYIPSGAGDPFDYGQSVITTKNRIRGNGLAIQIKCRTKADHDFHVYGYGMILTGNTNV